MLCSVCGANMKEYDEHYRCSNKDCAIKRNKCKFEPGPVSLYPNKHTGYSKDKIRVLAGTAIMGFFIIGFMVFLGGI